MNSDNQAAGEAALEAALARALTPPQLPPGFRTRVLAAIAQAETGTARSMVSQWEREHRERLAELEAGYLRLRRRTLVTLIAAAFAGGAGAAAALPWLQSHLGSAMPWVLGGSGVLAGLLIGAAIGLRRLDWPHLLRF